MTAKREARLWLPSVVLVYAEPLNESLTWVRWLLQAPLNSPLLWAVVVEVTMVKGVYQGFWATTASSRLCRRRICYNCSYMSHYIEAFPV